MSRKIKKIAFLSHLDINLYLFRLSWMKTLVKNGYQVYAIVPEDKLSKEFKDSGISLITYRLKRNIKNPFYEVITLIDLWRIFKKEKFDILHTFTLKPNIYGAIIGKISGLPCIINHITGLGYLHIENDFKTRILRFVEVFFYRITFRIVRKIIFQNQEDFNVLKGIVDINKAEIIKGSGVDVNYFSIENFKDSSIRKIRDDLGLKEGAIVITMVARLILHKGVREFVDAAQLLVKKYSNCVFLVVGWLDVNNPVAISKEYIKEVQANSNIRFLGERHDIKEILSITDIYTLPSYREGTPRTVLEAMAMSRPVVVTDVPGCSQTVDDGVNGFLVPVKNSLILAEKLEKLVVSRELRERMGLAGRKKVVSEFSDEIVINRILELYSEIESSLSGSLHVYKKPFNPEVGSVSGKALSPMVSIGISFYNNQDTLLDAVRSVFAQTFSDWELILIDDGSTDSSLEIARSIYDPRVSVIGDGQNRGLSYRLNQLVSLSRGEYFARMDADDIMHPERIKKQVEYLNDNPLVDLLGTSMYSIDNTYEPVGLRKASGPSIDFSRVLENGALIHVSVMGRINWFKNNAYDQTLNRAQDRDLWCRTYETSVFANLNDFLMYVRESDTINLKKYLQSSLAVAKICRKYGPQKIGRIKTSALIMGTYLKIFISSVLLTLKNDKMLVGWRNKAVDIKERERAMEGMHAVLKTLVPGTNV